MSKNKSKTLISKPFIHENLDFKNALIEYARELRKKPEDDFESRLVAGVLYAQLAEYLAGFLLESLRHLAYDLTYKNSYAIAFIDTRNRTAVSLDQTIKGLKEFSFSDKSEILKLLNEIKDCRNDLFHNFVSKTQEELIEIGNDIVTIQDKTEVIIQKINTVTAGLQTSFYPVPQEVVKTEEPKTQ